MTCNRIVRAALRGGHFITDPKITPPYAIGKVKKEVLQAGLDATNLVRYIAYLSDNVELTDDLSDLGQHGAVVLAANNKLTHTPSKPAKMSEEFYNRAYKSTKTANIHWGTSKVRPFSAVFGFTDDSGPSNIDRLGHRRWILNPPFKKTGFGVTDHYIPMQVFDRSGSGFDYDYVAWPSPGVFPTNLISKNTAWHITLNPKKYDLVRSKPQVKLEHTNSGKVWNLSRSMASSKEPGKAYYNYETNGFGVANATIFRPEFESSFKYKDGDVFKVTVSGVVTPNGKLEDIVYTVKMFDIGN